MVQNSENAKVKVHGATPVDVVVALFGGPKKTAKVVDLTPAAIKKWRMRGGLIPAKHQRAFLQAAEAQGLTLTEKDLIGEAA